MKNQTLNTTPVASDKDPKFVHHSDGSELIPASVPSEPEDNNPLVSGYTIDDEGILNNYAVEPATYEAKYPTPKQQLRYVLWGAGAVLLLTTILSIAFAVS